MENSDYGKFEWDILLRLSKVLAKRDMQLVKEFKERFLSNTHWHSFRGKRERGIKIYANIDPNLFYDWKGNHQSWMYMLPEMFDEEVYMVKYIRQSEANKNARNYNRGDNLVIYCPKKTINLENLMRRSWRSTNKKNCITYYTPQIELETNFWEFLEYLETKQILRSGRAIFTNPTKLGGVGWCFDIDKEVKESTRVAYAKNFVNGFDIDITKDYSEKKFKESAGDHHCFEVWESYVSTMRKWKDVETLSRSLETEVTTISSRYTDYLE